MTFEDVWTNLEIGSTIRVSDGRPPPSTNTQGVPYKSWRSHNFTGILKDKVEVDGWRSIIVEFLPQDRPDGVKNLAYEINERVPHSFEIFGV